MEKFTPEKEIAELVERESAALGNLKSKLEDALSSFIDYVLELTTDEFPAMSLSQQYPHREGVKQLTTYFFVERGQIYQIFWDPNANIYDLGSTSEKRVTKQDFLTWVKEQPSRDFDALTHLLDYIKSQ